MAVTACSGAQRLAVLPDGRILFASVPLALPLATPAVPGIARLFLIDPAQGKDARPVAVPADPQSLPGTLQFLAVPPDGKRVALVDGRKDAVAVLELATGKVDVVFPDLGWKCRTLPAWRSNDQLALAALPPFPRPHLPHARRGPRRKLLESTGSTSRLLRNILLRVSP